MGSVYNSLIFS